MGFEKFAKCVGCGYPLLPPTLTLCSRCEKAREKVEAERHRTVASPFTLKALSNDLPAKVLSRS
jgi:uncharacterized OB-fold protein